MKHLVDLHRSDTETERQQPPIGLVMTPIEIGDWRVKQWGFVHAGDFTHEDDFIEIYRKGMDPLKSCQFLVANYFVAVSWQKTSLSADGTSQFIIQSYSVKGDCCFDYYVVSIGKEVGVDLIHATENEALYLNEPDNPLTPDISYTDLGLLGWSMASDHWGSYAPINLVWAKDRYELEPERRTPPPTTDKLSLWQQEMTDTINRLPGGQYRTPAINYTDYFWQHPMELIYAGYVDMAINLLNESWPTAIKGKNLFWHDFRSQLQKNSLIWETRHLDRLLPEQLQEQ